MTMTVFFILGAIACAVYLLYQQGLIMSKSIYAVHFLFQAKRARDKVFVDSCHGWVRHVGRFRECRVYQFTLNCQLSKGAVEVSLLNKKKQELLRLTQLSPVGSIALNGKSKYYLRWEFRSATGNCELCW